jgi:hypothetical protein
MQVTDYKKIYEKKYIVFVDDNFHFMDESERYIAGEYDTPEEATEKCRSIVERSLVESMGSALSANDLCNSYEFFGEDPFIVGPTKVDFSAWDYARIRSKELIKISFTLDDAIKLATNAHLGQLDKGDRPYIEHPLFVMNMLRGDKDKMTGVLHDVVEDSPITFDILRNIGCPEPVIEALQLLTHDEQFDGSDVAYMRYVKTIADSGNQTAIDVKWADLTNNQDLTRIPKPTSKDRARLQRYSEAKELLKDKVSEYILS